MSDVTIAVGAVTVKNNTAAPIKSGERGFWADGDQPNFRKADGTDIALGSGGGGGSLQADYTAGGAGGGAIALTASGGPLALTAGDDAVSPLSVKAHSSTQSAALIESFDSSGNSLASLQMSDSGQSNKLALSSQLNGGYSFMVVTTAGGFFPITFQNNGGILLAASSAADFRFYDGSFSTMLADIQASGVHSQRFAPISSQSVAFSATPAFDPTAGNFIHFGAVTGNVTGPTMVSGQAGEKCTVVMVKDATAGTYTVSTSWGSNVRMDSTALAFTSGSGSLIVLTFTWDDRLSTPAWVETSRKAFN